MTQIGVRFISDDTRRGIGYSGPAAAALAKSQQQVYEPQPFQDIPGVSGGGRGVLPRQYERKKFTVIELDLGVQRRDEVLGISGTLIWATYGTDQDALVFVRIDTPDNGLLPFVMGTSVSGAPFNRVYLSNDAQAGKKIYLTFSADTPFDRAILESGVAAA